MVVSSQPGADGGVIRFGTFILDRGAGTLCRGDARIALRKKCWDALLYLSTHPGVLLSSDEILDAVWPGIAVAPKTLTNVIGELRTALDDDPSDPHYIETVHRRGYRFLAPAMEAEPLAATPGGGTAMSDARPSATAVEAVTTEPPFIGRSADLARLRVCLDRALAGEPTVALVAGEPGIGKSTLVNALLAELSEEPRCLLARVHCVEHHGRHEAYMPLLAAIGDWATGASETAFVDSLRRYAPTWLLQIPWLAGAGERRELERSLAGSGPGRMLREGLALFAALARRAPIVLVIEDLHWSDPATLELLAALALRSGEARVLAIGTYRPVEALLGDGAGAAAAPVATRLRALGNPRLALEPFTRSDVEAYLRHRFGGGELAGRIAEVLEERSGGNPLFLRAIVDHMVAIGMVRSGPSGWVLADAAGEADVDLPESLRELIEAQLALVDAPDREVLAVAAVVGRDLDVDAIAAGLDWPAERVDEVLHGLARRGQLVRAGARSPRAYAFAHATYRRALYEGIPLRRRQRLHQRVGEHLASLQPPLGRSAAELASHFLASGDDARAVLHLEEAAGAAGRRAAGREMARYLEQALERAARLAPAPERDATEVRLLVGLTLARIHSDEADHASLARTRARIGALFDRVEDVPSRFVALRALWLYGILASDYAAAADAAERTLAFVEGTGGAEHGALVAQAHLMLGGAACFRGEIVAAREHLEEGLKLCGEGPPDQPFALPLGFDPAVELRCYLGWALWLLGFPDRSLRCVEEALALAQGDPHSRALALTYLVGQHHLRGEWSRAGVRAAELRELGEESALDLWKRAGMLLEGWTLLEQGRADAAMPLLDESGATEGSFGADIPRAAFLGRLALACGRMGQPEQGIAIVDEALARIARTAGRVSEAELHRIKGELLVQGCGAADAGTGASAGASTDAGPSSASALAAADACFARALELSQRDGVRGWELRAAVSRARLWRRLGRGAEAREALGEVVRAFEEGWETGDLVEAREVLGEIGETGARARAGGAAA